MREYIKYYLDKFMAYIWYFDKDKESTIIHNELLNEIITRNNEINKLNKDNSMLTFEINNLKNDNIKLKDRKNEVNKYNNLLRSNVLWLIKLREYWKDKYKEIVGKKALSNYCPK